MEILREQTVPERPSPWIMAVVAHEHAQSQEVLVFFFLEDLDTTEVGDWSSLRKLPSR